MHSKQCLARGRRMRRPGGPAGTPRTDDEQANACAGGGALMTFSDDVLMAYADGELDLRTRAQVEDAIAADPQIARRVAAHQALRNTLRSGFDKVLDEPVPDHLIAAARATSRVHSENRVVVPLRPRRARTLALPSWAWPRWGAIAASFVLGALVWHFGTDWYSSGPLIERDGQLLAAG